MIATHARPIADGLVVTTRKGVSPVRRRILFIAEAVTLAHVARLIALARALDPESHDVCVACDPRYETVIGNQPFPVRRISTISTERFFKALANGSPIYDVETLVRYVEEDTRLIRDFQPEIVVGDFRLSLDVSARVAGVKYVTVTNAYWSPYAQINYPVPDIPLERLFGPTIAQSVFNLIRPVAFALHARPLNAARRRFGLPALPLDLRDAYTRADLTLYADIPELVPCAELPATHRYIGPVQWEPRLALPQWWNREPEARPTIYVTLGSSGASGLLPVVLDALGGLDVAVIASTAGRTRVATAPANAFLADYLPGSAAAERATVVISNGGSPTSYQALAAGKPVIGIAANLDQYLNMSRIEAFGAGVLLRAGRTTSDDVRRSVERVLSTPEFAQAAGRLALAISRYDAPALFRDEISGIAAKMP